MATHPPSKGPEVSPEQRVALRRFYDLTSAHKEAVQEELMRAVERLPQFSEVVRQMPPAVLKQQQDASDAALRAALVDGDWEPILAQQRQSGAMYAAMGIRFVEWFDLCTAYYRALTPRLIAHFGEDTKGLAETIDAMTFYVDTVMAEVAEEYVRTKERVITEQQIAIQELSTPVLPIRDRLLLLPLVGVVDTQRARHMTEHLLHAIRAQRARVVVMDITGVPAVDSKVANHLFQTVAAARLMGARVVVTGLSAEVAQALVALGIEVDRLHTVGDLQGGLEEAERMLGLRTTRVSAADPIVDA